MKPMVAWPSVARICRAMGVPLERCASGVAEAVQRKCLDPGAALAPAELAGRLGPSGGVSRSVRNSSAEASAARQTETAGGDDAALDLAGAASDGYRGAVQVHKASLTIERRPRLLRSQRSG